MKGTPQVNQPTLEEQEDLLEQLQDSVDAMEEVKKLTQTMGSFVVRKRIQEAMSCPSSIPVSPASSERNHKRSKVSHDSNADRDQPDASVKRMFLLYKQLQHQQALFQREIERFAAETEQSCSRGATTVEASAE